jgi:hypothetical protein
MLNQINTAAFGLYPGNADLEYLVEELNHSGFHNESICVLLPETHPSAEALKMGITSPDSAAEIEEVVAWLTRFGAVVIPGVGFFVAGRNFLGALLGARCATRKCSGVLLELGIPEPDAQRYEDNVDNGGVLVYVNCKGIAHAQLARDTLRRAGAEEASWLNRWRDEVGRRPLAKVS